jgi:hypothetical protein
MAALLIPLLILIVIFGPLLTIWSLNVLFPVLAIPYTLATWFAVIWLFGALRGSAKHNSSS